MSPEDWRDPLLDASFDLLTVHSRDGTVLFANAASRRLLGLEPEEFIGTNPFRLLHPDDRTDVGEAMVRLRDQPRGTHAFLGRVRHRDGSWRWFETVATNQLDQDPHGFVLCSRDVTDREAAMEALRASEARHRDLVAGAPFGMGVVDADDVVRFANPAAGRMLVAPGDLTHVPVGQLVHPDDRELLLTAIRRAVRERQVAEPVECRALRADGEPLLVRVSVVPYVWEDAPAALVIAEDVTALRHAEQQQRISDEQAQLLLESSAQGLVSVDQEDRLTFVNPAAARILGLDPESVLGASAHDVFHHSRPDGTPYPASECPLQAAALSGVPLSGTSECLWRSDGTPVPVDYQLTPVRGNGNGGLVMTFQDVSDRLRAQDLVLHHTAFLHAVLDAIPSQVAVVDADGTISAVNHPWTAFSEQSGGRSEDTGPGVNFFAVCDRVEGPDRARAQASVSGLRSVLAGTLSTYQQDVVCTPPGSDPLHFSFRVVPLNTSEGGAVLGYDDITERKRFELLSSHRAMHDELTGLPNRALLLDHLEHALRERTVNGLALLFIDLDHFKLVNDGYGHHVGDEVLREIGRRLLAAVRPSDTVARLSGDEFVVLCERLPFVTEAFRLAQRLLVSFAQPFSVGDTHFTLSASIGIAAAEDRTLTADTMLRAADQAMFEAKARGRNQFALYDDGVHQRSLKRVEQALVLRRLVDSDRLTVHYQPMVDLRDGRVTGVEALLRWRGGSSLPDPVSALAIAEETGMLGEIGARVLNQALRQAATFLQADGSVLPLSVNLAAKQLNALLVDTVVAAAEAAHYPLTRLTMEVTEGSVMTDVISSLGVLRGLQELGVSIALDDFGAGSSSLAFLRDLPLDSLKIEGGFVQALSTGTGDDRIIRAIIELGRALGLRVVAEGVESDEQRSRLVALGCHSGQGFLFGAAQPAARIRHLTS